MTDFSSATNARGNGKSVTPGFIADRNFRLAVLFCVVAVGILLFAFTLSLVLSSFPSFLKTGIHFITGINWDPAGGEFGVLPIIVGMLFTSILALALSIPFALSIAIFLGEYFRAGTASSVMNSAMELLAGIPSIIYGMWGLFVLVPIIRILQTALNLPPYGIGIFTASLLLSVMIIPYAASLAREVISMVPQDLKEAAFSLGATRYEVVKKVILPYSRSGIFAGIVLSFGRALGETMAVTMVIGNVNQFPSNLFGPGNTISSLIANEFTEASDAVHVSALIEAGLVLFLITMLFGILGRYIINKTQVKS